MAVSPDLYPFDFHTTKLTRSSAGKSTLQNEILGDLGTSGGLRTDEFARVVQDYRRAARNAIDAGFDLVEVHAAHGYLLHQFLAEPSNQRTDGYGGTPANRARFVVVVRPTATARRAPVPRRTIRMPAPRSRYGGCAARAATS